MATAKQIDCFNINMKFWTFLGVLPSTNIFPYYEYYSIGFMAIFVILFELLNSVNFYFLPRQLDRFVDEMIFYFNNLSVFSKALTFFLKREKIMYILTTLESESFQPKTDHGLKILDDAKKFNKRYWNIMAMISYTSFLTCILAPLIFHFILNVDLNLPICSYSFLSEETITKFIYPLYFYQCFGLHCHLLFNLNVDTFFLGIMVFLIAQLDILGFNLRNVTVVALSQDSNSDKDLRQRLYNLFRHFEEVTRFGGLIQETFSQTLFVQFSMSSCIICVCLFRFMLPARFSYYVFLATYMCVMIIQILVPCWFGTRISEGSSLLSTAIYSCDWTSQSREFKSSLRIFLERVKRPLSITGGKMFLLSLETFTSIMNSAYSFFTLLRNMQSREN